MTEKSLIILIFLSLLGLSISEVAAQENPPIPVEVEVRTSQFLNFGKFVAGSTGGTVVIGPDGRRTHTGDVYLLGNESSAAIYDIFANPGTLIQVHYYGEVTLNGPTNGVLRLEINPNIDVDPGQIFVTTTNPFPVFVGGTLHVPSGDTIEPGSYNANFTLTFIHE